MSDVAVIGLLSDTHGTLRPEVFAALQDVDRILHAGDVGDPTILTDLATIAPVTAVWGNTDGPAVRSATREEAVVQAGGVLVALLHGHQALPDPLRLVRRCPAARVVVYGHTHVPHCETIGGTLLVNPGAAGRALKGHGASVARLTVRDGTPSVRHVRLDVAP